MYSLIVKYINKISFFFCIKVKMSWEDSRVVQLTRMHERERDDDEEGREEITRKRMVATKTMEACFASNWKGVCVFVVSLKTFLFCVCVL